jgi:hypothetical protein
MRCTPSGKHGDIARSYYFNSWLGWRPAEPRTAGVAAGEVDVGRQEDPRFDRSLDFVQPDDRACSASSDGAISTSRY